MLKTVSSILVALGVLVTAGMASAEERVVVRPAVEVRVHDYRPREAPPAGRVETVRPRRGYFWVNGYYTHRRGHYVWTRGHWERNRRHYEYAPGRWEADHDGVYVWVRPRWHRI
jgi:hypothetical protein